MSGWNDPRSFGVPRLKETQQAMTVLPENNLQASESAAWSRAIDGYMAHLARVGQGCDARKRREYFLRRLEQDLNGLGPWEATPDVVLAVSRSFRAVKARQSALFTIGNFYDWARQRGYTDRNPANDR